jgi:hypothetical protein
MTIGLLCALALPALADDPLACVDRAVVDTLLAKPGEGPCRVSREMPADFPPIPIPQEFELIGSRASTQLRVAAFNTPLSESQASARLDALAAQQHWTRQPASPNAGRGFQPPPSESRQTSFTYCGPERASVTSKFASSPDGGARIILRAYESRVDRECRPMPNEVSIPDGDYEMPVLHLPVQSFPLGVRPEDEHRGSSLTYLESDQTPSQLVVFFSRQLEDQRWRRAATWSSGELHRSAWISPGGGTSGVLSVLEDGPRRYTLRFDALSANGGSEP